MMTIEWFTRMVCGAAGSCLLAGMAGGQTPEGWRGYVAGSGGIEAADSPQILLGTTAKESVGTACYLFDPAAEWAVDFETGALWRVTSNTFLNYTVLPQIISLRTPAHLRFDLGAAGELTLRSRFSLLIEPIVEGAENLYLGISGSPSIEWWTPSKKLCAYFSIGGGVGAIDSQGVPGGQGQDLTYNWFMALGLRYYVRDDFAVSVGGMFQHWSDRGATDPNPGLDQLGPTLGVTWHF